MVVPQLVARPEFLEQLEAVADETGAEFREIVLMDDRAGGTRTRREPTPTRWRRWTTA